MSDQKHESHKKWEYVTLGAAFATFVGLGQQMVNWIGSLYRWALTPSGLAASVLATMLISTACLVVSLIRKA